MTPQFTIMNPSRLLLTLALLFSITACKGQNQNADIDPTDPATQVEEPGQMTIEDEQMAVVDYEGSNEDLGVKTLSGKLTTTKGAQPMVSGVMINTDYFKEEGKSWREKVVSLEGKKVVITGRVNRHHCGAYEQCLSEGYIDSMKEIESFTVK